MYEKHIELLTEITTCSEILVTLEVDETCNAAIALFRAAEPKDGRAENAEAERWVDQWCWDGPSTEDTKQAWLETRAAARAEGYAAGQASRQQHFEDLTLSRDSELAELRTKLQRANETEYDRGFAAASGLRLADQAARAELEAELDDIQAESDKRQRSVERYSADFVQSRAKVESLETKLTAANARIAELETRPYAARDRALSAELTAAHARIAELVQARDYARRAMLVHEESIKALETKLTNLRAAAERAERSLSVLSAPAGTIVRERLADAIEASKK